MLYLFVIFLTLAHTLFGYLLALLIRLVTTKKHWLGISTLFALLVFAIPFVTLTRFSAEMTLVSAHIPFSFPSKVREDD